MPNNRRVLVVDDEPRVLRFVSTSLSLAGYKVSTSGSGEEALRLVKEDTFDIMVLDIFMVPMSGLEVLDRLRAFSSLPVIAFSARNDIGAMAVRKGANDFLPKPFKPAELVTKIKETLNGETGTQA